MEAFLLFLFIAGTLFWLIIHLFQTRQRLDAVVRDVTLLKVELQKLQTESGTPKPTPSPVPAPVPIPDPVEKAASTPPPLPLSRPEPVTQPTSPPPLPPARPKLTPPPTPVPASPPRWRPILEKLRLMPPGGESAEAAIGAWWLTRIGLVVLIIAAVFFGIRIAREVPPWVRVGTLAGLAAGFLLLGSWLERRLAEFGRLVAAGGLGLGYFTAFAAYGIEATRVIHDPAVGFLAQAAAVVLVILWSLWKRDEIIATMATLLGLVACGFSHWHGLDQFLMAGLISLAAGAGFLFVLRHWRWPVTLATPGAWLGFFTLAVFHWPRAAMPPSLFVLLGSLAGLAVVLEAANILSEERHGGPGDPHPLWRRWLAVGNTSLAVAIGWLAVRLAYPRAVETGELDSFYLVFTIGLGAFTAIRLWRRHPAGLTETYFLKACALLALFVVERYDGPTRWLSLAFQTGLLLWAWQRSRYRWVEVGFVVLLAATLALIFHDARQSTDPIWDIFSVRHIVGTLSLGLLSASLALHAHWARRDESSGKSSGDDVFRPVMGHLGGFAIGLAATALIWTPNAPTQGADLVWAQSLSALLLALPAVLLRRAAPVVAGLTALAPALIHLGRCGGSSAPCLIAGLWLAFLGLGLAELALHRWKADSRGACAAVRVGLQSFGLVALAMTAHRFVDPTASDAGWQNLLILAGFTVIAVWALFRQAIPVPGSAVPTEKGDPDPAQWLLAGLVGATITFLARDLFAGLPNGPSFLALASGGLFTAAYLTRNHVPALAGGLPLLWAVGWHLDVFHRTPTSPMEHAFFAGLIIGVTTTAAMLLARKKDAHPRPVFIAYDLVLHGLSLLVIHWLCRTHLDPAETFLSGAIIALAVIGLHGLVPFRALALVSVVPLVLSLLHLLVTSPTGLPATGDWEWWAGLAGVYSWLIFAHRGWMKAGGGAFAPETRSALFIGFECLAALAFLQTPRGIAEQPWSGVIAAICAVGLILWARGCRRPSGELWSALPLGVAGWESFHLIFDRHREVDPTDLIGVLSVAILIIAHGVVVTYGRHSDRLRPVAWIHGGLGLLALAFPVLAIDRFGVESLTTVGWGAGAILLFAVGFAAGLRPYRLVGLIGLLLALIRLFLVDIDDPLYRIYAFFAIALVLIGMGYLYQRFRHLIDRADPVPDPSTGPKPPHPAVDDAPSVVQE